MKKEKETGRLSFQPNPKIKFEGQVDDVVWAWLRSFPFYAIKSLVIHGLIVAGVVFLSSFLANWWPTWESFKFWPVILFSSLGLFLFSRQVLLWRFNCLIITDQRIVRFRRRTLLNKEIIDIRYRWLTVIQYDHIGILENVTKLGTVHLETVGESSKSKITMRFVMRPVEVVRLIGYFSDGDQDKGGLPGLKNS